MFKETLSKNAQSTLALLGKSGLLKNTYLAGGTALALQIGHRISVDFDFFTHKIFNEKTFLEKLKNVHTDFRLEQISRQTILAYLNSVRFSLFYYEYPLLSKPTDFLDINIAGIKDIAPMKLSAISGRGTKRDFIDLYFILEVEKYCTLNEIFELYDKKFKALHANKMHILKSITYFADAEKDPMPKMIKKVDWLNVKKFFETEAKNLGRKYIFK